MTGATFGAGRFGQAFSFDGVDDFVSFGSTVGNFGTSDFTVSYWIRTLNTTEIQGVFGKRPQCAHDSFWDNRINPTGTMNVELDGDTSATNHNSQTTAAAMNDGAFHLLTFVREGANLREYVDGALSGGGSSAATTNLSNAANLIAGKSACTGMDGTDFFAGVLDEIQLHDRALNDCEIVAGIDDGLDLDLDGAIQPLSDMLLLLRYYFGFRDATLVNNAVGAGCVRCGAQPLQVFIDFIESDLDVDGNGTVEPLTDALLLLRYAFGFRGSVLISGAVANDCSRCDATAIEGYLSPFFP